MARRHSAVVEAVFGLVADKPSVLEAAQPFVVGADPHGKFAPLDLTPADKNAPADETWRSAAASVQSLWEDAGGRMWVGLNGGIYVVENGPSLMLKLPRTVLRKRLKPLFVASHVVPSRSWNTLKIEVLSSPLSVPNDCNRPSW